MEIKDMTAVQLSAAIKEGKITVSDAVEAAVYKRQVCSS